MAKKSWAKGRKDPTLLVRLESDVYERSKMIAEKNKMTLKSWISHIVRIELDKNKHQE